MDIATAGALVGISRKVIATLKDVKSLFSASKTKEVSEKIDEMEKEFASFHQRIGILAVQLQQSEALTRQVPAWIEVADRMPLWRSTDDLDQETARILTQDLRNFVHDSIRDHFSGTFFNTNFDQLPSIHQRIEIFRSKLHSLDQTVNVIAPGNVEALKSLWAQLTTQFNDTKNEAYEIQRLADSIQESLITELQDTANEAKRIG